jgi:DNA mismatch repair protein MutL
MNDSAVVVMGVRRGQRGRDGGRVALPESYGCWFFLRSDGRRSLALPAAADLRERVSQVHGLSLAISLVALEDPVVWDFVSPLAVSFPTRRYLHVAVNGWVVEASSFVPAVAKAYVDLLPKGHHPAAFLRLELGPGEVDVNVHPAKSAVRLRGRRSAYPLVVGTIRAALAQERVVGGSFAPEEGGHDLAPIGQFAGRCIGAQEGEELIILDQHGAHERILYERFSENLRAEAVPLSRPVVAQLPEDLALETWNFEAEMETLGFRFEPFGEGALWGTAVPGTVTDAETALLAAPHALAGGEDLPRRSPTKARPGSERACRRKR